MIKALLDDQGALVIINAIFLGNKITILLLKQNNNKNEFCFCVYRIQFTSKVPYFIVNLILYLIYRNQDPCQISYISKRDLAQECFFLIVSDIHMHF